MVRDAAAPPHIVRWLDNDRLLISGADAASVLPRLRDKTIVQRTGHTVRAGVTEEVVQCNVVTLVGKDMYEA